MISCSLFSTPEYFGEDQAGVLIVDAAKRLTELLHGRKSYRR